MKSEQEYFQLITYTKEKIASKSTEIQSQKSKAEEMKATRAALKAKKTALEVKSSSHLTPDLTPPVKKSEEKQKDAGYKR